MYSPTPAATTILVTQNLRSRSLLRCGPLLTFVAWLALSTVTHAVTPAPDGGYPGGNTAEGTDALKSLTNGSVNTATGYEALTFNTTGSDNTATGASALGFNTTGSDNTASG